MSKSFKRHRNDYDEDFYYADDNERMSEKLKKRRIDKLLKNSSREKILDDSPNSSDEDW